MPHPRDVAVVTPWYPTSEQPFRGSFVSAMVAATAPGCDRYTLYHCDSWVAAMSAAEEARVREAQRRLAPAVADAGPAAGGARLVYLPVPVPRGLGHDGVADRHAAHLARVFADGPVPAPVVHAHVGTPTGWATMPHVRPGARFFVTEHASYIEAVLAEPRSREMYAALLERCTRLFAVSGAFAATLRAEFPASADKIDVIANPVAFGSPRPEPVRALRRWLYVGSLTARKAVHLVVDAFAACRRDDPALTLTLVGPGAERAALEARAAGHGVADAVTFTGAVAPEAALAQMRAHDLLVHASRWETFGMTMVEAVAAGLPVLVTRCGGPEETLAGVADAAAEFAAVEDTADSLVAGYRRLRDRLASGSLDLPHAREVLRARYSPEAVAAAHHRHWFGEAG